METRRILIVEDDARVLVFLVDQLESEGYEVFTARDGIEGLNKAKEIRPDLIILDVMLPKMDGYEVCQQLKQTPNTWIIPVLMLTAKSRKQDVVKGLEIGADDYLSKPYDPMELAARLKSLFRQFPRLSSTKKTQSDNAFLASLHGILVEYFNDEELKTLSTLRLNVDYESLVANGKAGKARELIMYLKRRDRISELILIVKELRPKTDWDLR